MASFGLKSMTIYFMEPLFIKCGYLANHLIFNIFCQSIVYNVVSEQYNFLSNSRFYPQTSLLDLVNIPSDLPFTCL